MTKLLVLFLALSSTSSFAAPSVKITSFRFAGYRTRAAELCGRVVEAKYFPAHIKITVDPKAKGPGIYSTTVWDEEIFCIAVMTDTGVADAILRNP